MKQQVTVILNGQQLPIYHVDSNIVKTTTVGEFLEVMPYRGKALLDYVKNNRVSLNGVEIEDLYETRMRGENVFIAILAGGVVAG